MTASKINKSRHVLINGQQEETLSPFDRGLAYGDGIFRTLPVTQNPPEYWLGHYQKLVSDCHVLGIVCPSAEILLNDIEKLIKTSPKEKTSLVVKIIITRGDGERGYAMPPLVQPNRILITSDLPSYSESNFAEGVKLHLCSLRLSHQPLLAGVKHLNRLENVLARAEWQDSSITDGVLMDAAGHVIECTSSNLFARFGHELHTPDLTNCGVAGVTRQRILDLSEKLSLQAKITNISLERLKQADEVIICNSLFGAWQVRELNHQHWPRMDLAGELRKQLNPPYAYH